MGDAKTLKKKRGISRGKIKTTVKNVLYRPDPVPWPIIPNDKRESIIEIVQKYKVDIPEFKKLKWSELKDIPKAHRPKPPRLKKMEGLIFGVNECSTSLKTGKCKAVILDADVNPQILVHHIIDSCKLENIPFGCISDLKKVSKTNFGFATCCLGVGEEACVSELRSAIEEYSKTLPNIKRNVEVKEVEKLKIEDKKIIKERPKFEYLKRDSTTTRVFVPPSAIEHMETNDFSGQNMIKVNTVQQKFSRKNRYLKNVIVKKLSSNPNRKRKIK